MIIPVFLIIAGLLTNGGFEEGKEAPAGWRVGTVGDVSGKVRWGKNIVFDNKISESGRSLKFLMNEPASEFSSIAANEGFGFESDLIPVEYGRKYLISADVRGEGKRPGAPLPSVIIFVKGFKDDPVKGKVMVYQFQMDCELKKPGEWKHFERGKPPHMVSPSLIELRH